MRKYASCRRIQVFDHRQFLLFPCFPALPCGENRKKVLGTNVSPDDALSVARFYEQQHELGKAGKFYR